MSLEPNEAADLTESGEKHFHPVGSVAQTPWTLVEAWRNEAVKHRAASGEDDCHAGTEEWFLHRESARIYASCADQLANTLSPCSEGTDIAAQTPGMRDSLEQIAIVCTDNMDSDSDHRMALDFVRQIANDILDAHTRDVPARNIREVAAAAIRQFCNNLGAGVVTISPDGMERIYYAGISLDALSAAVASALSGGLGASAPKAYEHCAKIAEQVAINAERRAAGHVPQSAAQEAAYNKMEGAQEVARQIRDRATTVSRPPHSGEMK